MQLVGDWWQGSTGLRKAGPWVGYVAVVAFCIWVIYGRFDFPDWFVDGSKVVALGASTAFFTRVLGAMGMFRDAIADVLGEDRWLDRRSDLEDLWRRITRRIFLPGYREDAPDAKSLLEALNATMTKMVHKPEQRVNYFAKNVKRRIDISWHDEAGRIVSITDVLDCEIIPFDAGAGCDYEIYFIPTTGETIGSYTITLASLVINHEAQDVRTLPAVTDDRSHRYVLRLRGRPRHTLSRTMVYKQSIDADPIFVAAAGRVAWGMNAIVTSRAVGLRLNFEEVGVDGAFRLVHEDARTGSQERDTTDALLPEQGFMVVMATNSPTRASAPATASGL